MRPLFPAFLSRWVCQYDSWSHPDDFVAYIRSLKREAEKAGAKKALLEVLEDQRKQVSYMWAGKMKRFLPVEVIESALKDLESEVRFEEMGTHDIGEILGEIERARRTTKDVCEVCGAALRSPVTRRAGRCVKHANTIIEGG